MPFNSLLQMTIFSPSERMNKYLWVKLYTNLIDTIQTYTLPKKRPPIGDGYWIVYSAWRENNEVV